VACNGDLVDTIINFGEDLPKNALDEGFESAYKADLCLVLGSSLTVRPACNMPQYVGQNPNGKLVICNLQKTPLDNIASCKIYAKCDDILKAVMQKLDIAIPPFILHRRMKISCGNSHGKKFTITGVDFDSTPATIFSKVTVGSTELTKEPFTFGLPQPQTTVKIILDFFGHYNEPQLEVSIPLDVVETYFDLHYNPLTGEWAQPEHKGPNVEFIKVITRQLTEFQKIPDNISKTKPPVPVQGGFSVNPKTDCPHFASQVTMGIIQKVNQAFATNSCHSCNDKSENWMCLTCGNTFCSRYVKGHAAVHSQETGHAVALSFSDLSIWCYSCDDYIIHEHLQGIIQTVSSVKFGLYCYFFNKVNI